ncbi:MAG: hypothetical protein JW928_01170 [Candidatus Aureabacteria bacterium]|nr:hypothetical protein [Candidatus Auribacterota bacterium]
MRTEKFAIRLLLSALTLFIPSGNFLFGSEYRRQVVLSKYNETILSYPKAYKPWTMQERIFVRSIGPESSKKDIFQAKRIFNEKRLSLLKDLEYVRGIKINDKVIYSYHKTLIVFMKRYIDFYTRIATTLGSRSPSNYRVLLNEYDRVRNDFNTFGTKYAELCNKYHVSPPAITGENIWCYQSSFGKR